MADLSDLITAIFKPQRQIGPYSTPLLNGVSQIQPITAQVTIEEDHYDELVITEHPVEQGAAITDHAYKKMPELIVRFGWSNSGVQSLLNTLEGALSLVTGDGTGGDFNYMQTVYNQLLALQESRIPIDITTGKRKYTNMLIRSLSVPTKAESEHSLYVTAVFRNILLVTTQVATIPSSNVMANPAQNGPPQQTGTQQVVPTNLQINDLAISGPSAG
jgi:hypothetical protein